MATTSRSALWIAGGSFALLVIVLLRTLFFGGGTDRDGERPLVAFEPPEVTSEAPLPGSFELTEDARAEETPAEEEPPSIRGFVFDRDGVALAGASVRVIYGDPDSDEARTGVTDATGEFSIGLPRLATFRVFADAPGHESRVTDRTDPEVAGVHTPLKIYLTPIHSVSGIVVDRAGRPCAELQLMIEGSSQRLKTSAAGGFTFEGLLPGRCELSVLDRGWSLEESSLTIPPEKEPVTLVAIPPAEIEVQVIDAFHRRPVVGAKVTAERPTTVLGIAGVESQSAVWRGGVYRLEELIPKEYDLVVRSPGYFDQRTTLEIDSDTMTRVTISLEREPGISGRVVDDRGFPLPGATVRFGNLPARATNRDGEFFLFQLTSGQRALTSDGRSPFSNWIAPEIDPPRRRARVPTSRISSARNAR